MACGIIFAANLHQNLVLSGATAKMYQNTRQGTKKTAILAFENGCIALHSKGVAQGTMVY